MFTGIVERVGTIVERREERGYHSYTVEGPEMARQLSLGSSVAVSGVCLTVTQTGEERFGVDVSTETLRRTSLGELIPGRRVNLELPLRADGRLDGHFVQGHVDGTGRVVAVDQSDSDRVLRIAHPEASDPLVVEKGAIAIDGVSLTVTGCDRGWFEVMLIPHTLRVTTLGERVAGDSVNVEYDILAKYLVRLRTLGVN